MGAVFGIGHAVRLEEHERLEDLADLARRDREDEPREEREEAVDASTPRISSFAQVELPLEEAEHVVAEGEAAGGGERPPLETREADLADLARRRREDREARVDEHERQQHPEHAAEVDAGAWRSLSSATVRTSFERNRCAQTRECAARNSA